MLSSSAGFEPATSGLEVQRAIPCATRTYIYIYVYTVDSHCLEFG